MGTHAYLLAAGYDGKSHRKKLARKESTAGISTGVLKGMAEVPIQYQYNEIP